MLRLVISTFLLGSILLFSLIHLSDSCNEAVCGSIVSKCLLTQSCKCDLKNCTCCKDCFNCLSYLYSECCSCVDMCPKPNDTESALSRKSHVEDITDTIPELFKVLTEYPDEQKRWNSTTFPVDIDISQYYGPKKEIKVQMQSAEQEVHIKPNPQVITLNCTVAFMSRCMSWMKCKTSCQSMGASSYRWFHDGCCECIGQHCINYGINESRCRECPEKGIDDDLSDDDLEYGESEEEYPED